jgi:AraC-like DNA-binding protein
VKAVAPDAICLDNADDQRPPAFLAERADGWKLFESEDVDETRELITSVMQPHSLSPMGSTHRHRGSMNYLPVGKVGIGTIQFGRMRVNVEELAGYHLLMFCLSGSALVELGEDKVEVSGRVGLHVHPGDPFCAEFSADCEQLIVRIDQTASRGLHAAETRPTLIDFRRARPWFNVIKEIVCDPAAMELIKAEPVIAGNYSNLLISLIVATGESQETNLTTPVPRCVLRAERFMIENLSLDLNVFDIAAVAGAPPRTLQDAFVKFRHESPMRRLRNMRLDHARRLLQSGRAITVTKAALSSGIPHFGRFAHAYRRRFGEAPSETKRCRNC